MSNEMGDQGVAGIVRRVRELRVVLAVAYDFAGWIVAYAIFAWLRFDGVSDNVPWESVLAVAAATAALFLLFASYVRLHQGRARVASLEEMLLLGVTTGLAGLIVFLANLYANWIPRTVPAGATLLALVIAAYGRATWRRLREYDDERHPSEDSVRVLVVGAGEAGRELIGSMMRDPQRQWRPVGLLDDDLAKRHRRIRTVPVVGTTRQLAEVAADLQVSTVILALPSASAAVINRLRLAAMEADVKVKVLPASTQLLTDHVGIRDLRDINLTDVLGRNQLDTDVASIAGYLAGRKVLVTGAGGSIGSELCRQISRFEPTELMMLDRDESALHALQLSIHGRALLDSDEVILCDIRDQAGLTAIFAQRRPDVVFHAAALKHLPMLEQYPAEAVKTNIVGSQNVLTASDLVGVDRFVNISTDKAANPCSVLGYSKRIAEGLTARMAAEAEGTYLSVRFGNVLGSRGSVLTSFARQIAQGGPVTVTDPEVSRYFMTIEEACQLVIQAAAIGAAGEALVLDMGEPVKIEFTGLRDGEKMHEELFGDHEPRDIRPAHPLVSHVPVPTVSDEDVARLGHAVDNEQVRLAMAELCALFVVPDAADYSTPR